MLRWVSDCNEKINLLFIVHGGREIRKYFARIVIGFEIIFVVIFCCPTAFGMVGVE